MKNQDIIKVYIIIEIPNSRIAYQLLVWSFEKVKYTQISSSQFTRKGVIGILYKKTITMLNFIIVKLVIY